ncbi:MAG: peptidoglycan -binding protein [Pseudomonadota bacterium]|nr:peptidoglycan -binding protein [Pseudomonadota bacterium]
MFTGIRRSGRSVNVWPGYVDALAALLMVVIFVLLIFTLAQFLLRQVVSDQEFELEVLHQRLAVLTEELGLERERSASLHTEVGRLSDTVASLTAEKQALIDQGDKDRATIEQQLLQMASLQQDIDALRKVRDELEARVGTLAASMEALSGELGETRDRSKALEARLAEEGERTLLAQKQVQERDIRIQALSALVGEQQDALDQEKRLSADAQAEMTLLNRRITELQEQLQTIGQALDLAETEKMEQAEQIEDLGKRLNIELARRVNELQRYRSEFFGRVKEALGENPDIKVEGDRFVFQSELLFGSGSAELGEAGKAQLTRLARTLKQLNAQIPANLDWILRVDGHTDRVPLRGDGEFATNWELSTARALSVVEYLASQGIPQRRMAATGFGEHRPLEAGSSADAYRKNRRIEIKLTTP